MAEYYFTNDAGSEAGPFNLDEVEKLIQSGKILPVNMLRNGRLGEWRLAMHFDELDFSPKKPEPVKKTENKLLKNLGCLAVITILVFGVAFYIALDVEKAQRTPSPGDLRERAFYTVTQDVILPRLKSPSTAKFSRFDESSVTEIPGGYQVAGWVDSQNGFGAMLRSSFRCKLMVDGTRWEAAEVNLSQQ
jgi:hypothetical protein